VTKYNLEHWYHILEKFSPDVTAKTIFFELSDEDLNNISALSKTHLASNLGMDYKLNNAELAAQSKLLFKIKEFMPPDKSFFCRLSTRSPKDGVSISKEDRQLDITSRLKKKLQLLAVNDANQILNLITRSQRVFSDIRFYFQYRVPGASSGKLYLMLRDFIQDLPIDHEFRCYVHNRKLTAISQYQCYCVFPALEDESHVLECRSLITDFIEKVKHIFPMESFVIDVVVMPDKTCQVIELNPFGIHMSSGSALYSWIKDYDLLYGKLDIDFVPIRILKSLTDNENTKDV